MRKHCILFLLIAVVLLSMPKSAYAETEADADVQVIIGEAAEIVFHPDGDLEFGVVGLTEFNDGWTDDEEVTVCVAANFAWDLWIQGDPGHPFFDYTAGGYDEKPCEDIWFEDGTGFDERALDPDDPFKIKSGPPGTWDEDGNGDPDNSDNYEGLSFWIRLDWAWDWPATYTYSWVRFTISAT